MSWLTKRKDFALVLRSTFNNPLRPLRHKSQQFIHILCSMLCLAPSDFYLIELGYDMQVRCQAGFCRPGCLLRVVFIAGR